MTFWKYIPFLALLVGTVVEASDLGRLDDDPLRDRVQTAAEELLAARFPDHAPRLRIRVVRVSESIEDKVPLRVRFTASESVPKGHTQTRVILETDNGPVDAGWAVLFVAHFDTVAVAHRDVAAGDVVSDRDLGTAWMDVTSFRGRPMDIATLARIRRGDRFLATQPIAAGDALRQGDLRRPYAADTGETVTLTYRRGPVVLRLPCRAREPGVVGDVVRLYSDATKSTYKARLTAAGEADWVATL